MSSPRPIAYRFVVFALLSLPLAWIMARASLAQDLFGNEPLTTPAAQPPSEEDATAQPRQLTPEDIQQLFTDGDAALKAQDYSKALSAYDQLVPILKRQPFGSQAQGFLAGVLTARGQALAGLDDPEAAIADFNEALQESDNYVPALIARGNLYLDVGDNESALADFQGAKEQDRKNPEVQFGLGKAYFLLGGAQQAIKPLTYAIAANENNAEAYRLRAQAYAGVGKYKEADEDIQKALSIDPDDHETYFALATILLREEKYPESVQAMEDAIQRYQPKVEGSEEPFAQGYLTKAAAILEVAKQEPDEKEKAELYTLALDECDKLLQQLGDSPQYASARAATEFRRGVCLRLLGRYGDAIAALTEAINLNPELATAYFRRGICFYYMDEDELAVLDFKHAGNIEYQDPRPRLWEGFAFAKQGDYYEAIRAYGEALAESDRYVPAYVNRGLAYMMLGENEKALADFNAAIRLEPAEWTHYFKRGMTYERLGKPQHAADSFISALRFYDKYPPAYSHAADALDALGQDDLAKEYRDKAAELEAEQKEAEQKEAQP